MTTPYREHSTACSDPSRGASPAVRPDLRPLATALAAMLKQFWLQQNDNAPRNRGAAGGK